MPLPEAALAAMKQVANTADRLRAANPSLGLSVEDAQTLALQMKGAVVTDNQGRKLVRLKNKRYALTEFTLEEVHQEAAAAA